MSSPGARSSSTMAKPAWPGLTSAPVHLTANGTSAAGATSQATASLSRRAGASYLVVAQAIRPSSTDPNAMTLAGWGQTWTEETTLAQLPFPASTARRRVQAWYCKGDTPVGYVPGQAVTAATLTLSYATQTLDRLDWMVIDLGLTDATPLVTANTRVSTVGASQSAGLLWEPVTAPAVADGTNRRLAMTFVNVDDSTLRGELSTDTNGDYSWTTGNTRNVTGGGRAITSCWSWAAGANTDTTPGFIGTLALAGWVGVVELSYP